MSTITTTLRIEEVIKNELEKKALEQNRSLNNLINTILMEWLEEETSNELKRITKKQDLQ